MCAIEENPDEEAEGDDRASEEGVEGGAGVEGDERREDREWEYHASRDLIERGVDIFQSIIAETVESVRKMTKYGSLDRPQSDDVQSHHGNETFAHLEVD